MANTIQAVIWDLDGVIIDSADEHRRAWQRLAQEEGITFTDADFWATFGKRNDDIIPLYWKNLSKDQLQALADRKEFFFREFIREATAPLPGSMELMRGLHEAGFPQALATSTPRENIQLIEELLHLDRYLSALVTGESVERGKPAPDIFLEAARLIGVDPKFCRGYEDTDLGMQAIRSAGMEAVDVRDLLTPEK